jgi:hypothetical protein
MVEKACELLPVEELPGLGPYLGTQGSKILMSKIGEGGHERAAAVGAE